MKCSTKLVPSAPCIITTPHYLYLYLKLYLYLVPPLNPISNLNLECVGPVLGSNRATFRL